ncbi:MAG: Wzz/FepE/Etk N-terminal domain-containing protein [Gammaproteobacteria bacterium]|nr:Wzz/FepE/Etk N-terminal domain-containing protein [Gammaproteobacteria bacterium]
MQEQLNQIYGYLHGMWRYRWSALLISWIAAMVGWVVVFSLPNQYQAKAVIYLDSTSVMKPLLKGLAVETDDESQELELINRILLSRENLLSVIRETDMDLQVNSPRGREKLVERLAGSIKLKGGAGKKKWEKKSNFYEISYQTDSSQRVYQVVSVLLNTMIEKMLSSSRTDTAVAQKFLNKQIEDYEERLVKAEQQLAAFKKQNVGMMPDETGGYYVRLQSAQDKVDVLRAELRLAQQRHLELVKQLKGEKPLLQSTGPGQMGDTRLQQYQEQLDLLLRRYTDQHPDVQALQDIIKSYEVEQAANQHSTTNQGTFTSEFNPVYQDLKLEISRASVEVETLKLQLSEQQQRAEKLRGLIDAIPEVEAKLAELNRDYDISRQRYLELVDRRESARLAELAGQSSSEVKVRVIEPPIVPTYPIGPNRPLLLFAVLIGAFGVGLGWCVLRYLFKPTVINAKQLGNEIELPVFGSVSLFLTPQHKRKRTFQFTAFMSVILVFVIVFGGVVWKQETGTELVRDFLARNNPEKLIQAITGFD